MHGRGLGQQLSQTASMLTGWWRRLRQDCEGCEPAAPQISDTVLRPRLLEGSNNGLRPLQIEETARLERPHHAQQRSVENHVGRHNAAGPVAASFSAASTRPCGRGSVVRGMQRLVRREAFHRGHGKRPRRKCSIDRRSVVHQYVDHRVAFAHYGASAGWASGAIDRSAHHRFGDVVEGGARGEGQQRHRSSPTNWTQ